MRKLMMLLTLSIAYVAVAGVTNADVPPACNPCPWVR
jgi:hypothetical protein